MYIDLHIRSAINTVCYGTKTGSIAALARAASVSQSTIWDWLHFRSRNAKPESWRKVYPHISAYLPDSYAPPAVPAQPLLPVAEPEADIQGLLRQAVDENVISGLDVEAQLQILHLIKVVYVDRCKFELAATVRDAEKQLQKQQPQQPQSPPKEVPFQQMLYILDRTCPLTSKPFDFTHCRTDCAQCEVTGCVSDSSGVVELGVYLHCCKHASAFKPLYKIIGNKVEPLPSKPGKG